MFAISKAHYPQEVRVKDSTPVYVSIPGDPEYLTIEEAREIEDLED